MAATREGRRIPTPIVLATTSAMVCIGVIAYWVASASAPEPTREMRGPNDVIVDGTTPEQAAESFLDAWRKRAHDAARTLSTGAAREAVEQRAADDSHLSPDEREIKERVWDQMATTRLALRIAESEDLGEDRVVLRGTAEGTFLERPYAREVQFEVTRIEGQWRVAQVGFGEILSDMPDVLDVTGRDPSEFEMRGEDVP